MSCTVRIQYYGGARELAQVTEEVAQLEISEPRSRDVLAWIAQRHPRLTRVIDRMTIAINDELSPVDDRVREGDLLSVMPPVAGGADIDRAVTSVLCESPLSLDEALRCVTRPGAGGVCMFIGVVRDHADGQAVARLDYEAHVALAAKEMSRILHALVAANGELRLCALHRVGSLQVGDLAVIVASSAPHRGEAFDACRAAIDQIKQTVPIWKKEWAPDGSAHWVNLDPQI